MTTTTTTKAKAFEKDQIVFCDGGCTMQLPTWYKVIKLTRKTVWLQKLQSHLVTADQWGQAGKKMPLDIPDTSEPVFSKRIKNWNNSKGYRTDDQEYAYIEHWGTVEPWDGTPQTYDSYD